MIDKNQKDWKKFKEENEVDESEGVVEEATADPNESPHDSGNALEHLSYEELEERLTITEQKAHENWEKCVRALAELDNVRRRSERDVANAYRYGLEKFITALLPTLDSLEQALQLAEKNDDKSMHEGLELTLKLFLNTLEKNDVQVIDPAGQPFNPHEHEAMSMQESSEVPSNNVLLVVQKGYKLNDRVIRPARVIVAS